MSGLLADGKAKYERDGLLDLFRSIPPFAFRMLALQYFERRMVEEANLRTVAETYGQTWSYESGDQYAINHSETSANLPEPFLEKERRYDEDPSFVYEIKGGRLVGEDALGFTSNDRVLLDTARNDRRKLAQRIFSASIDNNIKFIKPSLFSADERYTSVFPLVGDPTNYYVWILEYLPKLRGLAAYTAETGREPTILVRADPPSFMTESLEYLGFGRYDIVEHDADIVHADRLVQGAPHRRHNVCGKYQPHRSGYRWLRQRIDSVVDRDQSLDRIYVSRHDMENRRANNEEEVVEALEKRGFTTLKPSELSFAQQVQYFSDPEMIVGIHGSGFTNMIWAEDPTIVEVLTPNKMENSGCYCQTSLLDFEYDFIHSEGGEEGVDVNVDEFCRVIDSYLDE